jgi:inosine-uridine nucleoside N-ribohydrolase
VKLRTLTFIVASIAVSTVAFAQSPRRVIIDTDSCTDDAMAIILALNSPEFKVEALTVVPGNVIAKQGLENALKIVSLANRCDVVVASGAQHPLNQKLITAEFWHGKNGLANIELPPSRCTPDPRFGPDLIIEMIHKYPHEITLIPIGPLTNIALAASKDPSIAPLVREVVIMGGSINGGNVNAAGEFNIYNDPEAASIVFNAKWPSLTMVGSDIGERTLFTPAYLHELESAHGPQADFIAAIAKYFLENAAKYGDIGAAMYDPLAVGAAIDPTIITTKLMRVDVETRGEFTRGETVANRRNSFQKNVLHGDHYVIEGLEPVQPNAKVCVSSDAEKFLKMFVSRIKGK